MNWLDLVIFLIVGVSASLGLKIGLIRATLTALGIFVGSVLGGQLSDDVSQLFVGIDSGSAAAKLISYSAIFTICMAAAAVATMVLTKVVDFLFLGWADKTGGVAFGIIVGGVISAAVVMGMANVTYGTEVGDNLAGKVLNSTLDSEKAKERLEDGLTQSALVGVFVNLVNVIPASTLSFVPSNFISALDLLEVRQGSVGD